MPPCHALRIAIWRRIIPGSFISLRSNFQEFAEVSGCSLNGPLEDFLLPWLNTALTALSASGAGLRGSMPNLAGVQAQVDGTSYSSWTNSKLAGSLQIVDLSSNQLDSMSSLPASVRVVLDNNAVPLAVAPLVLREAMQRNIEVWLRGTRLKNPEELQQLLPHELLLKRHFAANDGSNFSCRELVSPLLQITPHIFMPEDMCGCRPGYEGFATSCAQCAENTYNDETRA